MRQWGLMWGLRDLVLVVWVANFLGFSPRSIDSLIDDLSYIASRYTVSVSIPCRVVSVISFRIVSCCFVPCRASRHHHRDTHRARSVRTVYSSRTDARRRFQLATQKDGSPFISFRDYRTVRRSAVTPRRCDVNGPIADLVCCQPQRSRRRRGQRFPDRREKSRPLTADMGSLVERLVLRCASSFCFGNK